VRNSALSFKCSVDRYTQSILNNLNVINVCEVAYRVLDNDFGSVLSYKNDLPGAISRLSNIMKNLNLNLNLTSGFK
jgi:hypothetical protein